MKQLETNENGSKCNFMFYELLNIQIMKDLCILLSIFLLIPTVFFILTNAAVKQSQYLSLP